MTLSKVRFQAKGKQIFGAHFQTKIGDYYGQNQIYDRTRPFTYDGDEPKILAGTDLRANPLEYILVALNGRLSTALIYNAYARGIYLDEVESTLGGDFDTRGII